jgi:hypothetical protein
MSPVISAKAEIASKHTIATAITNLIADLIADFRIKFLPVCKNTLKMATNAFSGSNSSPPAVIVRAGAFTRHATKFFTYQAAG